MCGVCGFVHARDGAEADPQQAARMAEALSHRGPDDAGLWHKGPAALAHQRLSILDLSPAGSQPFLSEDGRHVLVYNGEIYNFRELRTELEKTGHRFRTECDTEVLMAALCAWGEDAPRRLNGMFAFAFYDVAARRLLLARDRLGIKPLFYTLKGDTFAFASELHALASGGFVEGELDPAAVDAYFTYLYIPAPDTVFDGVKKLCPGELAVFEDGKLRVERYWRLRYAPDSAWTLDTAAEAYRALLDDSVRLRRIADVPLGAFLSGGLDSSSVVATMSAMSGQPVKTFCIGFDDAHADELAYARTAAEHFDTDHTEAVLRPDMVSLLPQLVRHFGEPFADSSALPTWLVSQVARSSVTVALSGDGGDELFAGYTWTHMACRAGAYAYWVPAPLRGLVDLALRMAPASPLAGKLKRFSADSFLSAAERFRRRCTCLETGGRAALYGPDFAREVAQTHVDRFLQHWAAAEGFSGEDRMLHQDTVMYLPDDILTKVDRMSMAHGLEARVPLLDHRIVEFAATLPFSLKYARGISKRVAKRAFRDTLPEPLLRQRKQGFAIPIQRWFREDLGVFYEETVLGSDTLCAGVLRSDALRGLLERHRSRRENLGHQLWCVLVFELWLRGLRRSL